MSVSIKGKVFTGRGKGKKFVELPWVRKQIRENLGFEPFPGTLNILLSSMEVLALESLRTFKGHRILPRKGYFSGHLYRALIMKRIQGAIVRPEISGYPRDVVEVIAPFCLRKELCLKDGDEVEVEIWSQ